MRVLTLKHFVLYGSYSATIINVLRFISCDHTYVAIFSLCSTHSYMRIILQVCKPSFELPKQVYLSCSYKLDTPQYLALYNTLCCYHGMCSYIKLSVRKFFTKVYCRSVFTELVISILTDQKINSFRWNRIST